MDKCLTWYECQDECTASSQMVLKNVRDLAAQKCFSNAKQLTLDTYFHSENLLICIHYTVKLDVCEDLLYTYLVNKNKTQR